MHKLEDHEIVSKDPHEAFIGLGLVGPGSQRRAEEALVARYGAFYLPAVPIEMFMEAALHLCAVFGRRWFICPSGVQGDHGGSNAQLLAAEPVVVLCIIGCVGQKTVKAHVSGGLFDGFGQLRRVVAGPPADHDPRKQVRSGMTDYRQLRPMLASKGPVALPVDVIRAGVPRFKARGVDGRFGALIYESSGSGTLENGSAKRFKSPFFTRRPSA